jgi:hypothetical protein
MTRVKFVSLNGEVLALFPDENFNEILYGKTQIMSYIHIGQHGAASRSLMKKRGLKKEEYSALLKELERVGYDDLKVLNKE